MTIIFAVVIPLLGLLPTARADCFIDQFGFERCSTSNAVRIGVAVAIFVGVLLLGYSYTLWRKRQQLNQNLAYIRHPAQDPGVPPQQGYYGQYVQDYQPPYVPPYQREADPNSPRYPPSSHAFTGSTAKGGEVFLEPGGFTHPPPPPDYSRTSYSPPEGPPPGR